MSSASLAVAHRPHPDRARIAALSVAIALNLAVIVIASRPQAPGELAAERSPTPVQQVRLIEPPAPVPLPPAIEMQPLKPPPALPLYHPRTLPTSPPTAVPTTDGTLVAPQLTTPSLLPSQVDPGPASIAAPVEASLTYRLAPLRFPPQALHQRMHGTVLLRVLVDETGKPVEVTVELGSGYSLLDRSAREQVLANWLFQPAVVNGRQVRAWARIPVSFDLR